MAEARRNWIRWLVLGALCLSAHALLLAQSNPADSPSRHLVQVRAPQSGSLAGRLTDLHSAPLAGVSIVLRNQTTGAEVRAITARNGAFRFASLDAGEYTLDADAVQLGHGRLEGILVTGGTESRIQAALNFEPVAPVLVDATAPAQIPAPPNAVAHFPLNASAPPASNKPLASSAATVLPATPPAPLRSALSTSTPQLIASIAGESLNPLPLTLSAAPDAIRTSVQPTTPTSPPPPVSLPAAAPKKNPVSGAATTSSASLPVPPALEQAQPQFQILHLPSRAALETRSASTELTLSVAQPNVFPLKAGAAPPPAATAVPPSLVQAAMLTPNLVPPTMAQPSDPVTPAVSTTVSASQLQALPASGRRWQEFLLDTPAAGASADSSQASYRGSQQSAQVSVDGANIGLAFGVSAGSDAHSSISTGADSGPQSSRTQSGGNAWTGGRGLGVSEAAIHEVTAVAGNVGAEGMRATGGRTTIRTESGSNALHGQGFLFDRQNTWGARNPFTQWVTETAPATLTFSPTGSVPVFTPEPYTPPDHETVLGLGACSRIRRDKLFWFAALDSYHRNGPGLAMVKHPLDLCGNYNANGQCTYPAGFFETPTDCQLEALSARLGFSGGLSSGCVSGLVQGLTAYSAMLETLSGLLGPAPRTAAQWVGFGRIDWLAAERHHFTFEGIGADWNSPRRRSHSSLGNLLKPQLRLQPSQPAVAARSLGSVSHPQPAGCHAGLSRARSPQRKARHSISF